MRLSITTATVVRAGATRLGPVDLEMELGGITAVMGHNGAGKSLFLRLIHGLIAPQQGQVMWDGQSPAVTKQTRGYVFQAPKVMRRSVAANVGFPLEAAGMAKPERVAMVGEVLVRLGLSEFAARPAATLSGGEGQRMALARALVANPAIILLDEPTASTDPEATALIEQGIKDFVSQGGKAIMVTHDEAQAARLASRTLWLEQGQLKS